MGTGTALALRIQQDAEEPPRAPQWSIDEVAEELLKLYHFLIRAYISEWRLRVPPTDGWPQITTERFAALNKDPIVIDLLKRIPYISTGGSRGPLIWKDCRCNDYAGLSLQYSIVHDKDLLAVEGLLQKPEDASDDDSDDVDDWTAPYFAVLGLHGSPDGWCLVLDSRDGTVYAVNPMSGHSLHWSSMRSFRRTVKQNFIRLRYMPIDTVTFAYKAQYADNSKATLLRELLGKHHFGKKEFSKRAYMVDVAQADLCSYDDPESTDAEPTTAEAGDRPYNVADVASHLLVFYRFLSRMYIPSDMLRIPPRTGWDEVSSHDLTLLFPSLGWQVFDFLRYLPYIRQDLQDSTPTLISEDCVCIDYSGQLLQTSYKHKDHAIWPVSFIPEDIGNGQVPLATTSDRTSPAITFDLATGHVRRLRRGQWLEYTSIDIMLHQMRTELEDLSLVPLGQFAIRDSDAKDIEKCREVYRKAGWPGEAYDKSQCIATLKLLSAA